MEWSAAIAQGSLSLDRWVRYGMEREEIAAFLASRGADPQALFQRMSRDYGPPIQVACGQDGPRTKLYWFLESGDPYFIGLDLVDGHVAGTKWYRGLEPDEAHLALASLPDPLKPHLEWLLESVDAGPADLFHLVLLSREVPPRYSGVHVGISPDWEGLLTGHPGLLQRDLAADLCDRLNLGARLQEAEDWLFGPPMAWTAYLSLLMRADGSVGANIYTRATPVIQSPEGLSLVEPGRGGVAPRPVLVSVRPAEWPHVEVRMRTWGDHQFFRQVGGWSLDYTEGQGGALDPANGAFLTWLDSLGEAALTGLEAGGVSTLLDRLRGREDLASVSVGPDMRYQPKA